MNVVPQHKVIGPHNYDRIMSTIVFHSAVFSIMKSIKVNVKNR